MRFCTPRPSRRTAAGSQSRTRTPKSTTTCWWWTRGRARRGRSRRIPGTRDSPVHDDDIWIVDVDARRLQRVTDSDMAGIAPGDCVLPHTIHYTSFDGRSIPALFYSPPGSSAHPAPVLVCVHGGPEDQES